MPQLADCKTTVMKSFGAGRSNKSLVAVARIEEGEFITLFGSDADGNAAVVTKKEEVEELQPKSSTPVIAALHIHKGTWILNGFRQHLARRRVIRTVHDRHLDRSG